MEPSVGAQRGYQPLRVAVVGTGYWAQNMLRAISASHDTELVTLCDTDAEQLERVGARYPTARLVAQASEIFTDEDIDAVYIATPPASHYELAMASLRSGKHVLVEKPITVDGESAERLADEAAVAGLTLMVGHTFLFSPPVLKVKELINSGTVGDVFYIDSHRVNLGKYQDSGVMWDLAPHDLSIVLHWLGETPSAVMASGRSFRSASREDVVFLTLDFPSGAVAQLHVSWLAPVKLRRTTLSGSQRMVVYDDTAGQEAVKVFNHGVDVRSPETFGEFQLTYRQGDIWVPRLDNSEPLRTEWDHFVESCNTGSAPRSDAYQGLAVVRILEAADRSLRTGQRVGLEWNERRPSARPRFGLQNAPSTSSTTV